jgi:hypothetical protein
MTPLRFAHLGDYLGWGLLARFDGFDGSEAIRKIQGYIGRPYIRSTSDFLKVAGARSVGEAPKSVRIEGGPKKTPMPPLTHLSQAIENKSA